MLSVIKNTTVCIMYSKLNSVQYCLLIPESLSSGPLYHKAIGNLKVL